jgi:CelD/BcsL family acetyltransferase involved in cellulose biosynthesis
MTLESLVQVEKIESAEAFERLAGEWTELLAASRSDCLFLTWEWLFTWWKHLSGSRRLSILAVRSRGELIALAPFASRPRRLEKFLSVGALEFLGTGSVGSDYLDLIVRPGHATPAIRALAAAVIDAGAAVGLGQVPPDAPNTLSLADELGKREWTVRSTKTDVCPFIDLTGHSWDSYLDDLGSAHRYNFRRRLRNLERLGAIRFARVETEAERGQALRELVALHQMRWQPRGGSSAFDRPALADFHEELSGLALARGWLRLFTLRLDDVAIAAVYGFRYRNTFYFYQSGFDPRHARASVGLIAVGLSIKAAVDEGATEYDFLHGDEAYKFHWARRTRELGRLELYPPHVRGRLYRRAIEANRAARRTARRVLPQTVAHRIATGLGIGG